jgi:peptide/nickel transport system ATP-binding protein
VQPLLEVRRLRVEIDSGRGASVAVDDVSFDIPAGEVLGIVGEFGAGKSLTASAIIGLLDPPVRLAGGEIHLAGKRIDNLRPAEKRLVRGRQIGAIFQDPLTALDPLFTIGDQLVETISTHLPVSRRGARERARALLGEVGISAPERRLDHYPHQLSGGMRQRVVVALALAAEPRLIVADEPTSALDVSVQAQIIALLRRLCDQHAVAIMLITHDMGVIVDAADRVAVMYAGRIAEIGPTREIVHAARHPYTVGLMRCVPKVGEVHATLAQISGAMPQPSAVPPGCAFHSRCPHVIDRCRGERPDLSVAGATRAACWLYARES